MGPRLFQSVVLKRPTLDAHGDRVVPASGVAVSGAVWNRRRKAVIGGAGELYEITAQGFLPAGVDVKLRDQLEVSGTDQRYDVVTVVSAFDDSGTVNHVGVELRDI